MKLLFPGQAADQWAPRDRLRRVTPALPLIAVAALCWAITARRMQGMDMGPGTDLGAIGWFAGVWVTMMAAMMLPSLVRIAPAYARASRRSGGSAPNREAAALRGRRDRDDGGLHRDSGPRGGVRAPPGAGADDPWLTRPRVRDNAGVGDHLRQLQRRGFMWVRGDISDPGGAFKLARALINERSWDRFQKAFAASSRPF